MKALWYNSVRVIFLSAIDGQTSIVFVQPRDFEIKQVPIPKCGDDDVLLKGTHYFRLREMSIRSDTRHLNL